MLIPGLVSISFRKKTPEAILALCERAELRAIEWGGDVHVPSGDTARARQVLKMTRDAGLTVCSYGSYYALGQSWEQLEQALDCAEALETNVMRIWAGSTGSAQLTAEARQAVIDQLLEADRRAQQRGLTLALEYHGKTLTDARSSVRDLLETTQNAAYRCYWQPRFDWTLEERLASLSDLSDRLSHLHVFTWAADYTRLPLCEGEAMWREVFARVPDDHYTLLEFVQNDSDESLLRDAECLNRWIKEAGKA